MSIEDYLNPKEKIKKEYTNLGSSDHFATDRRLIDYKSRFFSERYRDMDYKHITSIEMKRSGFKTLLLLGIALIITGIYLEEVWITGIGVLETFFALIFRHGKYNAISSNGDKITLCRHTYFTKLYEKPKESSEKFIRELRKLKEEQKTEKKEMEE